MSLKQGMREIDKVEKIVISEAGLRANINNYVKRVTGRQSLRAFIWQEFIFALFGNLPTAAGSVLRAAVYRSLLGKIGSNCFVEEGVRFRIPQKVFLGDRVFIGKGCDIDVEYPESEIRIGDDVHISRDTIFLAGVGKTVVHDHVNIGPRSFIYGYGGVEIGKNSLLADNVRLMAGIHGYQDASRLIRLQGALVKKTTIGQDVWLGSSVIVLAGVTVGDGAVIGAGAVVSKDILSYSIAVGIPAKVIGKRE
ncbi:MAG: acyltransferase [Candidatus Aminicenantes bacterium]|nr:MAG: acyltransferase [Candidatus Aminicenantes bacterium]